MEDWRAMVVEHIDGDRPMPSLYLLPKDKRDKAKAWADEILSAWRRV